MKVGDLVVYENRDWEIVGLDSDGFAWLTGLDDLEFNTGVLISELSHKTNKDTKLELVDEFDPVEKPSHYNDGNIEVIEYILDKKFGYLLGNAIKYISRSGKKNPDVGQTREEKEIQDLEKAIWYIQKRVEELNGQTEE